MNTTFIGIFIQLLQLPKEIYKLKTDEKTESLSCNKCEHRLNPAFGSLQACCIVIHWTLNAVFVYPYH
jgi:hypothetical protein